MVKTSRRKAPAHKKAFIKGKAINPKIISYDQGSRDKFDAETQRVLDLIQENCDRIEIEPPSPERLAGQWFVQIYRVHDQEIAEGFFGASAIEAAKRVASALGIKPS